MGNERTPTELKPDNFPAGVKLLENLTHEFCALQERLQDPESRLFVDDADAPKVALLCSRDGKGIGLIAGESTLALPLFEFALSSAPNPLRLQFISVPSDDWRHPNVVYPEAHFFELQRVSFTLEDAEEAEGWQTKIPDGFSIQSIDQALAYQIHGGWSQWFPEVERFTSQGIGFCALHNSQVVSLAYGVPVSGAMEIVVETDKEFQRQGLAYQCCGALIEQCIQQSIKPLWSAGATHQESTSLAKKLGFANEQFHWWLVRRR